MNLRKKVIFTWLSVGINVVLSLTVAVVCFKVLESAASTNLEGYELTGGIAAFIITFSVLFSVFQNIYKMITADEVASLQQQVQELQTKLIKGAPCPPGYTIDVDEKHKLVFSRPDDWEPHQGILYWYLEKERPSDPVIANFNVVYANERQLVKLLGDDFDPYNVDVEEVYRLQIEEVKIATGGNISTEYVMIDGYKSVKYVNSYPAKTQADQPVTFRQSGVLTYVPHLKALYVFTCTDNEEDFLRSSEVFNNVIASIRFLS